MAPCLHRGPAVELLPFRHCNRGRGSVSPLQASRYGILGVSVKMFAWRIADFTAVSPRRDSSFQLVMAHCQISWTLEASRSAGGSCRSAISASTRIGCGFSCGMPGAPVSLLNLSPFGCVITGTWAYFGEL